MSSIEPEQPWNLVGEMGRRRFLKLLGSSVAALGLSGCSRLKGPSEALPYVEAPGVVDPTARQLFATQLPYRGYARGVVVESMMGRPIKVDGGVGAAAGRTGSDAPLQASLLDLYDPDRLKGITRDDVPVERAELSRELVKLKSRLGARGEGLHILTDVVSSPWLEHKLRTSLPGAQWHRYTAFDSRLRSAQGFVTPYYDLTSADLIVSLGEDFLGEHPERLRLAREFGAGRGTERMSTLCVVETTPTLTGAAADRAARLSPGDFRRALEDLDQGKEPAELVGVLALLQRFRGRAVVMGGAYADPAVVHRLNQRFGNLGRGVSYRSAVDQHPDSPAESLQRLQGDLSAGQVKALLILGGDPVATSGGAFSPSPAPFSLHLTERANATSRSAQWVVPRNHPLESWGDSRSYDGAVGLVQPLMDSLYPTWSEQDVLSLLTDDRRSAYHSLRDFWRDRWPADQFEQRWEKALRQGSVETESPRSSAATPLATTAAPEAPEEGGVWVVFRPDPYLDAGESGNNPWLLELPRPLTRLAWSNPALVSPNWARARGLAAGDHVEVSTEFGKATFPVFLLQGQPDDVVTLILGWGQPLGRFAEQARGVDAFPLRGSVPVSHLVGRVEKVSGHTELAEMQTHHRMEGRDPVRQATIAEWREDPKLGHEDHHADPLYVQENTSDRRWGMVIDLSKCIGCNACTMACGAENNLPVVGPEQSAKGRAMHWLRVDRYEPEPQAQPSPEPASKPDPEAVAESPNSEQPGAFQPVPCMHCENAPCERVCPVGATLHNREGLNQMVYNRCVGTRFCANNCPYKVRRFNYLDYQHEEIESWTMARNPEVTVRARGVMEKCTYCTQRIEAADVRSRIEERPLRDGDVVTACQAACPTRAIVFGDLGDPESEVARLAALPHNYGLLSEIGTRPRTTYLARLRSGEVAT